MAGFAGVDKVCRGAGAGQCCSYLFADMAGFSHASDYDAPFTVQQERTGFYKVLIDPRFQGGYRLAFEVNHASP